MTNVTPRIIELKGPDPQTAFQDAQRDARHYYGNSGRTGTIADNDGSITVEGPALLPWDARRAAQQLLRDGHASPAGPAFLFTLADPTKTRTARVTVDITDLSPGQADDAIDAAIRIKLPEGWGIADVELRESDAEGDDRKGTLKTKTVLTPGKGTRTTRYTVRADADDRALASFDTLAEAKDWMKEAADNGADPMHCNAEIGKEDGPLVSVHRRTVKRTVVAVATLGLPSLAPNGTYLAAVLLPTP